MLMSIHNVIQTTHIKHNAFSQGVLHSVFDQYIQILIDDKKWSIILELFTIKFQNMIYKNL